MRHPCALGGGVIDVSLLPSSVLALATTSTRYGPPPSMRRPQAQPPHYAASPLLVCSGWPRTSTALVETTALDKLDLSYDEMALHLSTTSLRYFACHTLSQPLSVGGFGLKKAQLVSPAASIASLASIAASKPPPALAAYCDGSATLPSDS